MRETVHSKEYPELDGIFHIAYVNKSDGKLYACYLNREILDGNGDPWYMGAYGNCLIHLKSMRTDVLYLLSDNSARSVTIYPGDIEKTVNILNVKSDRIITRDKYDWKNWRYLA